MSNPLKPSANLLAKIGSIVVHADEATSAKAHQFDVAAIRALLASIQDLFDMMSAELSRLRTAQNPDPKPAAPECGNELERVEVCQECDGSGCVDGGLTPWGSPIDIPCISCNFAERERLAAIGASWEQDSSLEKWLPFTAAELERLRDLTRWRDAEKEAPVCGVEVLMQWGGTFDVGKWNGERWLIRGGFTDVPDVWMPLPPLPKEAK